MNASAGNLGLRALGRALLALGLALAPSAQSSLAVELELSIQPEAQRLVVVGRVPGLSPQHVHSLVGRGLAPPPDVSMRLEDDKLRYEYALPLDAPGVPSGTSAVRTPEVVAGFGQHFFLRPAAPAELAIELRLTLPAGWSAASTSGTGELLRFASWDELWDSLYCWGPIELSASDPDESGPGLLVASHGAPAGTAASLRDDTWALHRAQERWFESPRPARALFVLLWTQAPGTSSAFEGLHANGRMGSSILLFRPADSVRERLEERFYLAHELAHDWLPSPGTQGLGEWFDEGLPSLAGLQSLGLSGLISPAELALTLSMQWRSMSMLDQAGVSQGRHYPEGLLRCLLLELGLRRASSGERGLRELTLACMRRAPEAAPLDVPKLARLADELTPADSALDLPALLAADVVEALERELVGSGLRLDRAQILVHASPADADEERFLRTLLSPPLPTHDRR